MKPIPLQLVTVCLENGQQGVFVGVPLVAEQAPDENGQIEDIWFSDIQEVPAQMEQEELIRLLQAQLCRCQSAYSSTEAQADSGTSTGAVLCIGSGFCTP